LHCSLAGTATGVVVLGLGGRLATALVAIAAGRPSNLSARGLLEVVVVGALFGVVGGHLAWALRRALPGAGKVRGVLAGGGLFAIALLWSWLNGHLAPSGDGVWWTLAVVGAVFLIYGLVLELWLEREGQNSGRARPWPSAR
jgi:hypothetical protein